MYKKLFTLINTVPDFPKKGITFFDLNPIFSDNKSFDILLEALVKILDGKKIDKIVGIESRGFILGAALAQKMGVGFVPLRKAGKLPPPVIKESYTLEYGSDSLEIHSGKGRVALVDDVLATGGTLSAAASLCEKAGFEIASILVILDLKKLNQFSWKTHRAQSLFQI